PKEGDPKPTAAQPAASLGELLSNNWWLPVGALALFLLVALLGTRLFNNQAGQAERAEGVRLAISSLNADLLGVVRSSLGNETSWQAFDDGLRQLNRTINSARALQQNDPALQPVLQSLDESRQTLENALKDRRLAYEMLRHIEQLSGQA